MPGEAERRLAVSRARARDHARAARLVFVVRDAEAPLLEQTARVARAVLLAARRVDRVVGEERAGERDGVGGAHVTHDTKGAVASARQRARAVRFSKAAEKRASGCGSLRRVRGAGAAGARRARRR